MAVRCEFIDVIVPIAAIDRVYPGGFAAFKASRRELFGGRLWHDDFLFRDGAMSPADAKLVVEFWEGFGLTGLGNEDGRKMWTDMCVVEHMFGGPTFACDWLIFDEGRRCVYLKGAPPEPIIGREDFARHE